MTPTELKAIRELWGPHKKFPLSFVDYPEVNTLLDAIPDLIAALERAEKVVDAVRDCFQFKTYDDDDTLSERDSRRLKKEIDAYDALKEGGDVNE